MKEIIYYEAKVKKSKTPIDQVVKKLDIIYPNSSLGFLHAVYASVDGKSPNRNGVILAESVSEDVPKLRFTQVNMNHRRELGPVLGTILDAWINPQTKDIEIVFSFFKSLYSKHWEIVEKAIANGDLTVSFELKVDKKDIEIVSGGYRKLKRVDFDGVGLLFPGVRPAYKNAKVLAVANQIVNEVFNSNNLVYASTQDAVNKLEKTSKIIEEIIKSNEEENKVEKKNNDKLLAKFKEDITKELGEEVVKEWSDEQWESELEKRAKTEEQTEKEDKASEKENTEEAEKKKESAKDNKESKEEAEKKEESSKEEQKEEAQKVTTKNTENRVYEVTEDSEAGTMEVVETITTQVERDGKVVKDEKVVRNTVYTEAKVDAIKADYETLVSSKDEEIKTLKTQVTAYEEEKKAEKISSIRAELGDFAKDMTDEQLFDEDKIQIARLKKQISELENKETTVETANDKKENLEVASQDSDNRDERDKIIARKEYAQNRIKKLK